MWIRVATVSSFAGRFVQELPAFAGDARRLADCSAEIAELRRDVLERRLELGPPATAVLREEHVARDAANDRADGRGRKSPGCVAHSRLPFTRRSIQLLQ